MRFSGQNYLPSKDTRERKAISNFPREVRPSLWPFYHQYSVLLFFSYYIASAYPIWVTVSGGQEQELLILTVVSLVLSMMSNMQAESFVGWNDVPLSLHLWDVQHKVYVVPLPHGVPKTKTTLCVNHTSQKKKKKSLQKVFHLFKVSFSNSILLMFWAKLSFVLVAGPVPWRRWIDSSSTWCQWPPTVVMTRSVSKQCHVCLGWGRRQKKPLMESHWPSGTILNLPEVWTKDFIVSP